VFVAVLFFYITLLSLSHMLAPWYPLVISLWEEDMSVTALFWNKRPTAFDTFLSEVKCLRLGVFLLVEVFFSGVRMISRAIKQALLVKDSPGLPLQRSSSLLLQCASGLRPPELEYALLRTCLDHVCQEQI
jgi:hypothetical protein